MNSKYILTILSLCVAVQLSSAGVLLRSKRGDKLDAAIADAKVQLEEKTLSFYNNNLSNQKEFFKNVQEQLPATSQRVKDIERYLEKLQQIFDANDAKQKEQLWRDLKKTFDAQNLLDYNEAETGVSKAKFEEILVKSNAEKLFKMFFIDMGAFFWEVSKINRNTIQASIDEAFEKMREQNKIEV